MHIGACVASGARPCYNGVGETALEGRSESRDMEIVIREKPPEAPRGCIVVRDGQPQLPPHVVPV